MPLRLLAESYEILKTRQARCEANPHPEGHHPSKLEPRQYGAVDTDPNGLTHDGMRLSRRIRRKSQI